jgi:hypothetical protein
MLPASKPSIWARFTDGTQVRVVPGTGPSVMIGAPRVGLTETLFRLAVNSIDTDVNEQTDG